MNGHCSSCPVEQQCGYAYKPCDCCNQRKFIPKIGNHPVSDTLKPTAKVIQFKRKDS